MHTPDDSPDVISDGSAPADRSAVVTLWFVDDADVENVIRSKARPDRGFGRKYLAQQYPSKPITVLGEFPLNRSAQASAGEIFVGGYPGITVVQLIIDDALELSQLSSSLRSSLPATDIYAFALNEDTTFGGVAHWHNGELYRSLCVTQYAIFDNEGLPEGFEAPLWAGERDPELGGIALPFTSTDLVSEAQRAWLGIRLAPDEPDVDVVGFALDGRPEPKVSRGLGNSGISGATKRWGQKLLQAPSRIRGYDDYDSHDNPENDFSLTDTFVERASQASHLAKKAASRAKTTTRKGWSQLREKLRHLDRD